MLRRLANGLLLLAGLLGLAPVLAAQPAVPAALSDAETPWTLERLEAVADQLNPLLPRDRAQVEAARGQALQAGLWSNPRFDTNNPQVLQGRNSTFNAGFQQEIPVMGKKRLDQAAATEQARQQELNYHQDRYGLLTHVRRQFYQVLADQQRLRVLTELTEVVQAAYTTGEKRRQAGEVSRADVLLLQIDLQRIQAQLQSARFLLAGDRKQLAAIVGVPGLRIDRDLVGQFTGGYPDFSEEQIDHYIATGHTQVRAAESIIRQSKYQLRRAEVEPYPNPYMGPAYQYGLIPGNDQFWFNVSFPIPVWDRNQGGIRAAHGNLVAAENNIEAVRNDLRNQAANLLGQYRAALATVREFEANILPGTRESVRLAHEGYAKGLTDFATYLTAQRSLVQANSDYLDALLNLWNNAVQLAGLLQMDAFPGCMPPAAVSARTSR